MFCRMFNIEIHLTYAHAFCTIHSFGSWLCECTCEHAFTNVFVVMKLAYVCKVPTWPTCIRILLL